MPAFKTNKGVKIQDMNIKMTMLDRETLGDDISLSGLEELGALTAYQATPSSAEEIIRRLNGADIAIINKVVLTAEILKCLPKIKLVALMSTGTNAVDVDYCRQNGISVRNVADYSTNCVVQHTFAMLFYIMEGLNKYDEFVKSGAYSQSGMFTSYIHIFPELYGKTWGIIGLGSIGKKVAQIAQAFGCNILYYSTSGKNNDSTYRACSLDELLQHSDIISIHCPLNENTRNLINTDKLKLMKKTAYLLNLARGGIVNETELANCLNNDIIKAAALDVMEFEPLMPDNPLLHINDKSRLLITPHIAWISIEARNRLIDEVCRNIDAFIKGEARNIVV